MATSPTYNWPEPDNTDLVKNGALAIRTLGNAIDTTMATMTPKSTVTAKGSLIAATAASTPANLAVGANGETLVADSSTATGLRYQSAYNGNGIINGAFDLAQRGTSINTAATTFAYTLDRLWVYSNGPAITTSQQATGDTTNLPNIQYCARLQRQSGQTSTGAAVWNIPLETKDAIRFAGQNVVISFYGRKSSTLTAGTTFNYSIKTGTGTDQSGLGGYTGEATPISTAAGLTNNWQRFISAGTISSSATELRFEVGIAYGTGTAGANDYVEITGIQLELGSVATSFKRAGGGTIQQELALCQRYFAKSYNQATAPATNTAANGLVFVQSGATVAASAYFGAVNYPVTMRTTPTITIYSYTTSQTGRVSDGAGTDLAASSGAVNLASDSRFTMQNNSGGALTAATGGFVFHYTVSAEL